ncbi:MAG: hypothetical protein U9O06_10730 [Euryarchaeota archaeon]|nr:hypothetical protein [Euryarchaeota archaeon]
MSFGKRLRSVGRPALVVLSLWLLIGGSLWGLLAISYGELLLVLVGIAVCLFGFSRLGGGEATDSESVWNAIPSWQYDGRHAESGGLARGEQEQALQEIHDDAQRRDEHHRGK